MDWDIAYTAPREIFLLRDRGYTEKEQDHPWDAFYARLKNEELDNCAMQDLNQLMNVFSWDKMDVTTETDGGLLVAFFKKKFDRHLHAEYDHNPLI